MKTRLLLLPALFLFVICDSSAQSLNDLAAVAHRGSTSYQVAAARAVDVSSYGARCDGRTDDSDAFARAEAAAGANGKVYVRSGTCIAKFTINTPGQWWEINAPAVVKQPDRVVAYTVTITADHVTMNGTGTIDGNSQNADSSNCRFSCGAILIRNAAYVSIIGLTVQNSLAYNIFAADTPYLAIQKSHGYNAGFHSFRLQITHPPSDGSDSIKGVKITNNLVDTTGNPCPNKDSFQVIGYYDAAHQITYYYDGLVFSNNTSVLKPASPTVSCPSGSGRPAVDNVANRGDLGDRVEFGYLRNSTISNNKTKNGRLGLSVNGSVGVSMSGNTATGISETCFEEVGNTDAVWTDNSCSDGTGKAFGGGLWLPTGAGSKNVMVGGLTGTNMSGGGVGLYYATNPTFSGLNLEAPANASPGKQACVFLAWTTGAKISNLTCNGVAASVSRGVSLYNSLNASITESHFSSLLSAVSIKADDRGPGGMPHAAMIPSINGSLPANTTYYARVVALCPSGSTVGAEGHGTTSKAGNTNSIDWAWAPVACATSYQLWVGRTPGGENSYFTATNHTFMQTVESGKPGAMPTSSPTSTAIGNVNLSTNRVNGVKSMVSSDYARGAVGGSGIAVRNTVNEQTGSRIADVPDYTRSAPRQ
ncbi:hypothetical protein [Occallatibacter riparius]|uniref:Pectate lyase superfamily protein domain-containing protein n=1 Tax=Occallatibacter riparius TaxID=1002689 RepID=A0A9J7BU27_9BACT|nr:hypothetical protein [Occallatibacter riparius]UWZ86144.1 hypothetical protein MOP44_09390 [Occallatibacter riparius]